MNNNLKEGISLYVDSEEFSEGNFTLSLTTTGSPVLDIVRGEAAEPIGKKIAIVINGKTYYLLAIGPE